MGGLLVLRFDPKKGVAHDKVRNFYSNLQRFELAEKDSGKSKNERKSGLAAQDYEKRFVEDDWADLP